MSYVYLLHFDRRINDDRPTQHYIGHADDLRQRIRAHRAGRYGGGSGCAKLCAVAHERGISFRVARLWQGGYDLERRLKAAKAGRRLCPICSARPLPIHYADELPVARDLNPGE